MNKRLKMAANYSRNKNGDALLVWKNDVLIYENYHNGYNSSKPHMLYEVSTVLSGLMTIAAINDGLITFDEPVSNIINQWQDDPQKSKITISQLLHLTSGIAEANNYVSTSTPSQAAKNPVVYPSGKQFSYGPTAFKIFGSMMARIVEEGYLKKRILLPIGVSGGCWLITNRQSYSASQDTNITVQFFNGAQLTARELGQIGILLLNNGRWNGKTILKNLNLLTKPVSAAPGYGLGVWLNTPRKSRDKTYLTFPIHNPVFTICRKRSANQKKLIYDNAPSDLFMAAGKNNQRIYIIPSKNLIIVRFGHFYPTWNDAEFLARLLEGKCLKSVLIHHSSKPI
jgi:CubicO group peptidase (beta-lactamase class C family)